VGSTTEREPALNLLLDTHIFIWCLLEPGRLTPEVAARLDSPSNALWLSPISVWEILVLAQQGRLRVDPDPATWLRRALRYAPVREAPLVHEVAIQSRLVQLRHADPADRFIVATAAVYGLTLVTGDERIIGAGVAPVVPNR
jgi:PIN domain nuclease of toxin-antitoxin system